jgi:hypothetical protein
MTERILLSGASGLIGEAYMNTLKLTVVETIRLIRKSSPSSARAIVWDPYASDPISDPAQMARLEGLTAAIHLSGANLAGRRWSESYKKLLYESRVKPTYALTQMLASAKLKPRVLVCASAIGIYGTRETRY